MACAPRIKCFCTNDDDDDDIGEGGCARCVTTFSKHNNKLRRAANESRRDKTKFDTRRSQTPKPQPLPSSPLWSPARSLIQRRDVACARNYAGVDSLIAELHRRVRLSGKAITRRHHPVSSWPSRLRLRQRRFTF